MTGLNKLIVKIPWVVAHMLQVAPMAHVFNVAAIKFLGTMNP